MRQLKKSKKDHLLQPVYSLSLVNDVFEPDINDFYHYYRLVHEDTRRRFSTDCTSCS